MLNKCLSAQNPQTYNLMVYITLLINFPNFTSYDRIHFFVAVIFSKLSRLSI